MMRKQKFVDCLWGNAHRKRIGILLWLKHQTFVVTETSDVCCDRNIGRLLWPKHRTDICCDLNTGHLLWPKHRVFVVLGSLFCPLVVVLRHYITLHFIYLTLLSKATSSKCTCKIVNNAILTKIICCQHNDVFKELRSLDQAQDLLFHLSSHLYSEPDRAGVPSGVSWKAMVETLPPPIMEIFMFWPLLMCSAVSWLYPLFSWKPVMLCGLAVLSYILYYLRRTWPHPNVHSMGKNRDTATIQLLLLEKRSFPG